MTDHIFFAIFQPNSCLQVYTIVQVSDGTHLGVARVAAPAFPKDKLESEVIVGLLTLGIR